MSISLALPHRIRWGLTAAASTAMLALLVVLASLSATGVGTSATASSEAVSGIASTPLVQLAAKHPGRSVEAIVQFENGVSPSNAHKLVRANGGRVTGDLPIINGLAARMTAAKANGLAHVDGVRVVSLNAGVKKTGIVGGIDTSLIETSYPDSVQAPKGWSSATGSGVGVAVVDTGIAGTLPDFRTSQSNSTSRVVATVATNPYATTDNDSYGHGTHVAGIIAGDSNGRPNSDSLKGRYVGVAPDANLISVKVADEKGDATLLDVIYGLQFAVDNKDTYNIRVINLSLESSQAQSYKTDPLDAAAEAAWFNGIVVVAAAGNRGTDDDAVDYAPGNDPYVISVGGVDDQGTKNTDRRRGRELVEQRHDAGRLREAGRARAGRPHRLEPLAQERVRVDVPELHRRRAVHPRRRHLDGGADGRGCGRGHAPDAPGPHARPGQGGGPRQRPQGAGVLARRGLGQQPRLRLRPDDEPERGPHAQHADRPEDRRHRLQPVVLEPLLLEPVLLEPVELEPVELELRLLQDQDRVDRPDAVELEPELLVHELDQVRDLLPHTKPHLPRQTARLVRVVCRPGPFAGAVLPNCRSATTGQDSGPKPLTRPLVAAVPRNAANA